MIIRVIMRPDILDGGWVAALADRPGVVSDGATQYEALRNLAEAWEGVDAVELFPEFERPSGRALFFRWLGVGPDA